MDGIQGAFLRVKLRRLDAWTEARRAHAARYRELFAGSDLRAPAEMSYAKHVYHIFAVQSEARDELQTKLTQVGIQTNIHYPIPIHLQPAYASLGYQRGDFPEAERQCDRVLSLPMFAELTAEQVQSVTRAIAND